MTDNQVISIIDLTGQNDGPRYRIQHGTNPEEKPMMLTRSEAEDLHHQLEAKLFKGGG